MRCADDGSDLREQQPRRRQNVTEIGIEIGSEKLLGSRGEQGCRNSDTRQAERGERIEWNMSGSEQWQWQWQWQRYNWTTTGQGVSKEG